MSHRLTSVSTPPAVQIDGLVKSYRGVTAVAGLSLRAGPGQVTAILGPNGAGKTTTIETCEGYRRPDGGSVRVLGLNPVTDARALRPRVGVMLQSGGVPTTVRAAEYLRVMARFYRDPLDPAMLLERLGLTAAGRTPYKQLSGGQQQRLALAAAIVGRPELVFLDEPTAGLDPQSRARMWREVRRLRDEGMTIFLTTHYLDEADALCDRISIIDAGLIVAEGTPSDLKREISGDVIIVDLAAPDTAGAPEPEVMIEGSKILAEQPYVHSCETIGNTLRLYVDSAATAIPQVMRALSSKGIEPGAIESRRPSLDDVFLAKTGRTLAD